MENSKAPQSIDIKRDASFEIVRLGLQELSRKYGLSAPQVLSLIEPQDGIPLHAFAKGLGVLEAAVKFLHETRKLRFCEIAELLNRDERTIWVTYAHSKKKHPDPFMDKPGKACIPLCVIADRKRSVLENIAVYLKANGMSFKEIAASTSRPYASVWTAHRRATRGDQHA
ncbi:MAG: hypothetical protein V1735_03940 [Nanoarchaeota archaeon]